MRAAFRRDIEAADDPAGLQAELEAHYHALSDPMRTAERFLIVDIIEPRTTRRLLCDWISLTSDRLRLIVDDVPRQN